MAIAGEMARGFPIPRFCKIRRSRALAGTTVQCAGAAVMESRPRVLVVEDDMLLRGVICEQLAHAGYEAQGVADGAEAVRELRNGEWETVLTDWGMPRMNGLELLRIITGGWPDTPVVMISVEPSEKAMQALRCGAFAWIQKPYGPMQLLQTVRAAVERACVLRALARGRLKPE
jgi:DNA-binding response OmpR family regulator